MIYYSLSKIPLNALKIKVTLTWQFFCFAFGNPVTNAIFHTFLLKYTSFLGRVGTVEKSRNQPKQDLRQF